MTSWADEIQASMYTEVDLFGSARLLLLKHVRLMLIIQEFDDGLPRIAVVDVVPETGSVDNGEANYGRLVMVCRRYWLYGYGCTLEEFLLELSFCNFDFHSFVNLLGVPSSMVCVIFDGGGEEGVYERRLAKARLASNLQLVSPK